MRRSISTTSGASSATSRTASSPSPAAPTTSIPGSSPSSITMPSRTTVWSSATTTRAGFVRALGHTGTLSVTTNPSSSGPASSEPPSSSARSRIPSRPYPPPVAGEFARRARPSPGPPGSTSSSAVLQPQLHLGARRVLADVRQRLLRDPAHRLRGLGGQRSALARTVDLGAVGRADELAQEVLHGVISPRSADSACRVSARPSRAMPPGRHHPFEDLFAVRAAARSAAGPPPGAPAARRGCGPARRGSPGRSGPARPAPPTPPRPRGPPAPGRAAAGRCRGPRRPAAAT